jgi:hypothetical protein
MPRGPIQLITDSGGTYSHRGGRRTQMPLSPPAAKFSLLSSKGKLMPKVHMESIRNVIRFGVPATITGTLCNRMAAGEDINSTGNESAVTCKFCKSRLKAIEFSRVGTENAERANRRDGSL